MTPGEDIDAPQPGEAVPRTRDVPPPRAGDGRGPAPRARRTRFGTLASRLPWLGNLFYGRVVGAALPVRWFAPEAPRPDALRVPAGRLHLQIVSHCWNYAHLLRFQTSSLVLHPPADVDVTYSLYYAEEDRGVAALVAEFDALDVPNVTWQWNRLPKHELFRRAIGRNRAALASEADWLWFADCDLILHAGCLDSLAASLAGRATGLVYPARERITPMLPSDHPMLNQTPGPRGTIDIDPTLFADSPIEKAKGAFQICHGDVARAAGYCGTIEPFQRPTTAWRKTYEDTVFRRLIGYPGEPVDVRGLHRIRHVEKGRYAKGTLWSRLRGGIRRAQG